MRFDIVSLFPEMFEGPFRQSIVQRAVDANLVEIRVHNLRDYASDRHRTADDYPFGGGPGMVMKAGAIFTAVESILAAAPPGGCRRVILLSPQGRVFTHPLAAQLAKLDHIVLLCGHYEGVDERVPAHLVDEELSIGDYVLTGGEIPAMVVVDAVVRLLPGVLHHPGSVSEESHAQGLLEYPQYTRPMAFRGWRVPSVLLSGDHAAIAAWRRRQALWRTWRRRPDLLATAPLTPGERELIRVWETWAAGGQQPVGEE